MTFYDAAHLVYRYGTIQILTTLTPIMTYANPVVTSSGATIPSTLNPEGSPGQVAIIATTSATPTIANYTNVSAWTQVSATFTAQSYTPVLTSLAAGTKYYYRAAFYNAGDATYQYGPILSLTTLTPIMTSANPVVTSSGATIPSTLNPEGSPGQVAIIATTSATPTIANYTNVSAWTQVSATFTAQSYTPVLTSLAAGTKYYYRAAFYNAGDATYQYGPILSLTTLTPLFTLATPVWTRTSASISGTLNPEGSPGQVAVIAGTSSTLSIASYNAISSFTQVSPNFTAQNYAAALANLTPGATYFYRAAFYNAGDLTYQYGPIMSFVLPK